MSNLTVRAKTIKQLKENRMKPSSSSLDLTPKAQENMGNSVN